MHGPSTPAPGTCPSCGSRQLRAFHEQRGIPVNSCLLVDDRRDALDFPTGDLRLELCRSCGFIFNALFDPALTEYSPRYEETQGFSPHFRRFALDVARRWVDRYDLHDRDIVEIGCGKGEFLALMCELGGNRGVGIDPSYRPERLDSPASSRMRFFTDFYGPDHRDIGADAVVCRHTLEHIAPVAAFLDQVRAAMAPSEVALFELPDAMRVLNEGAFWDVYYEHCSYFTAGSLARLFRSAGFDVLDLATVYGGQYLLVDARPGPPTSPPRPGEETPAEVVAAAGRFAMAVDRSVSAWRRRLYQASLDGKRTVIWGAGSKAVSFLTVVGRDAKVAYAVDVNPNKHGKFLPGSGHLVVAPEFLKGYQPDLVIAMNSEYQDEIGATLTELGVPAELLAL